MFFLISRGRMFLKRFNTASCWDTFSCHIGDLFIEYFSLLSIVTTRRMRFSLTGIVVLSQWNFGFGVCKLPMTIAWYFEWFCFILFASHDVTKIQTTKLSMLLLFYFHDVLGQLKTNLHAISLQKGSWFCDRVRLNF